MLFLRAIFKKGGNQIADFKRSWLLFLLILLLTPFLTAQEAPGPAILLRGPEDCLGLPLGYSNSVPCLRGSYIYGDIRIDVFFTDIPMELGAAWESRSCGRYSLNFREAPGGGVYYYSDPRGWGVFMTPPGEISPCSFISPFIERLSYFQAISDSFSFPAILEID